MCGIAGIWNRKSNIVPPQGLLKAMCDTMVHRGPDGEGYHFDRNGVGLGHRRLNIIDIEGGKQPLANEDETVWVTFNGEIYNFKEVRSRLELKGHRFKTRSDTEVIVHAYEEYGEECLGHFRGMFAFAIWDSKKKKMLLTRDRVGKKPLYYHLSGGQLVFASELKAILAVRNIVREINQEALVDYFFLGYVPSPKSIFKSIQKLPPAHFMVVTPNESCVKRYWNLCFEVDSSKTENDYSEGLKEIFYESTKLRLVSDVPLGAFLSGGVDSSSVVALMHEAGQKPLITNAIGFDIEAYDELEYAKEVAERFNTIHHEYQVEVASQENFEKILGYFDEPFADSSAIPTYYVSKLTRQNVTVALSGDGGDENFAGYSRYSINSLENKWRERLFLFLPFIHVISKLYPQNDYCPRIFRGRTFLTNISRPQEWAFWNSEGTLKNNQLNHAYSKFFKRKINNYSSYDLFADFYHLSSASDHLSKLQDLDIRYYLCEDIMTKVDYMTMANSLESRAPLLDHKLMEFVAAIPPNLKLKNGKTKYILKKTMAPYFAPSFLDRKKQGFSMPIAEWMRGDLRSVMEEKVLRSSGVIRECFDQTELNRLWRNHQNSSRDHSAFFWAVYAFKIWEDKYLK